MSEEKKRLAFYIEASDLKAVDKLKKEVYFNQPYSSLYRDALKIGIKAMSEKKN